jgi:hypothetical protein
MLQPKRIPFLATSSTVRSSWIEMKVCTLLIWVSRFWKVARSSRDIALTRKGDGCIRYFPSSTVFTTWSSSCMRTQSPVAWACRLWPRHANKTKIAWDGWTGSADVYPHIWQCYGLCRGILIGAYDVWTKASLIHPRVMFRLQTVAWKMTCFPAIAFLGWGFHMFPLKLWFSKKNVVFLRNTVIREIWSKF